MNDNSSQPGNGPEQWEAFQKVWADTFNKMLKVGMTFSPESTPPEFMKQMRSSIFQAIERNQAAPACIELLRLFYAAGGIDPGEQRMEAMLDKRVECAWGIGSIDGIGHESNSGNRCCL